MRIAQFNGGPAGQTVFHLHFHVIPVWDAAPASGHGDGDPADPGLLQALAARIAAHLE